MSDSIQKRDNYYQNGHNGTPYSSAHTLGIDNRESEELTPKRILSILFRYKWFILLFLILGGTGAWYYANSLTPEYKSTGTLLISSNEASPDEELAAMISKATGYGTSSTLVNELEILRSRKFSTQVAETIMQQESTNISEFPILWSQEDENTPPYRAEKATVASRIRKKLDFVQSDEESDVIEIGFTSTSPVEAARIVNLAMENYVDNSTRQNRQAAQSTADFLEKEKRDIKQKLEQSEERLRQYMDSTGIVQVDEQANGMVAQRAEIESELKSINLELQSLEEAIGNYEAQLERIKPGLADQFSEAIGPRIRQSQEELAAYESERTLIIAKNPDVLERDKLPNRLKYVNEQIERLKTGIKDLSDQLFTDDSTFTGLDSEERAEMVAGIQTRLVELRIEQNQKQSRRKALQQHKQEMDASFNALPEDMIGLAKLKRDVRINEELYMNVSEQYADMSVWKQSQFGFGRIIDSGMIPTIPVSPNRKMILIVGLMLAGVISGGMVIVKEILDQSLKNVDQLRRKYVPKLTLSEIPRFEKVSSKKRKSFTVGEGKIPNEMVMLNDPNGLASESFRRLKNNIIYKHGDIPPKTLAITSPEKGDGKSTIVVNLGVAFAEEGYKTLIVETDFRRPKLSSYLGLKEKPGLTEYFSENLTYQDFIQHSELKDLKVIVAGKNVQRPEVIGSSTAFKSFLERMEEVFDIVILDTPPFGIISDSASLIRFADSTVVVARYRKTNKGMLIKTVEELEHMKANVTNIVLNDFDHRKENSFYYGRGYYRALNENYNSYIQ